MIFSHEDELLGPSGTDDPQVNLAAGLRQLATGELSTTDFLKQFGHRGPNEMELSQPRYCEVPPDPSPATRPTPSGNSTELRVVAKTPNVDRLREFVGLREFAKHHFMAGYHQLRRMLVEFDRRFDLHGGVFYLAPEELPRLAAGRWRGRGKDRST